ncbi:MAG: nuclear transport factor 2 family protein [Achromobacter sp.]
MSIQSRSAQLIFAALICAAASAPAGATGHPHTLAKSNAALVQQAFDNWEQGRGSVFDLLAENSVWTVAGTSPFSGTYRTREEFMTQAVLPINARLATPITPDVKHIVAQGEHVVVMWDGTATAKDGSQYENSYAWHLTMQDGKITQVNAFLDTWKLAELMR